MQSYSETCLKSSLTSEEKKIFDLQHTKPVFGRMGEVELLTNIQQLIYKISVITGWKLPEDETYLAILIEQLFKKIREDYQALNADEVEHAFRKNTQVKDWGKAFNLSLIDQVLIPYTHERREIKEFIERLPQNHNLLTMPADWKELCEDRYQQFLTGTYNVDLWPWQLYDEFVKCGWMEVNVYEDYLKPAYYNLLQRSYTNIIEKDLLDDIRRKGVKHQRVIEMAKRLSVQYLYAQAKKQGRKNLFIKQ